MRTTSPSYILRETAHRPAPIPKGPWVLYQNWVKVIFLHFKVNKDVIVPLLPKGVLIDLYDGDAWASIVAFTVKNAHPRFTPSLPGIASFHEVNLRTYVTQQGLPGITFFDIKANNIVQVFLNRLAGLPYRTAYIERKYGDVETYKLSVQKQTLLNITYTIDEKLQLKTDLDKWLTERYYNFQQPKKQLWKYPIHHWEWRLQQITVHEATVNFNFNGIRLTENGIALAHYGDLESVLFWLMRPVKQSVFV